MQAGLDRLAHADGSANPVDVAAHGRHDRPAAIEHVSVTGGHHGQRAALGAWKAAAHRTVDHLDTAAGKAVRDLPRLLGLDRGRQQDDAARFHGGLQAVTQNDGLRLIAVHHHDEDRLGLGSNGSRRTESLAAHLEKCVQARPREVESEHFETTSHQILSQARAHIAKADHTDILHHSFLQQTGDVRSLSKGGSSGSFW